MESGWNVWVWLVGVMIRRRVSLVGVGRIYGCGCKEVHSNSPYPDASYPGTSVYRARPYASRTRPNGFNSPKTSCTRRRLVSTTWYLPTRHPFSWRAIAASAAASADNRPRPSPGTYIHVLGYYCLLSIIIMCLQKRACIYMYNYIVVKAR